MKMIRAVGLCLAALLATGAPVRGEEGMWTFDHLPVEQMKARYGFAPDPAWLDHVRLSALRFPGGSGAFISRDGLVLTNHHVAHAWIEKVSDASRDYVRRGFLARSRSQEVRVPGLAVRTLLMMEDVTLALAKAGQAPLTDAQAVQARKEALAQLVQAAEKRTGLACEPVSLFHGGETWIYGYEVHTDVRLVMAPEFGIAAFGGDWDNFAFPRHDLDFSLFRVYEQGLPFHPSNFLQWSRTGLHDGDMTFVVGHPGRTSRLDTLAQMEADRDIFNPLRLRGLDRARKALHAFAARGPEQAREVSARLLSLENAYKIYVHETEGLHDQAAMARVAQAEQELRAKVAEDPGLRASTGPSWDLVNQAVQARSRIAVEMAMLNDRGSRALSYALGVVRWQAEAAKPLAQRVVGFRTRRDLDNLKANLTFPDSPQPELEEVSLATGLEEAVAELGPAHPVVAALLEGRSPRERAQALVAGTRLLDPAFRRKLFQESPARVQASTDPMLMLAWKIESLLGPFRKQQEQADAVIAEHGARIARARFALYGKADYPDATSSLRISYGSVATYPANGTLTQPFTTFGGLFDRADGWGPSAHAHSWALPPRWQERRSLLNPSTPYNFISSNDIIGGNSGSPVLNRKGELVGLVFDGNIASVPGRYYYDPRCNRAVSVDGRAILEALAKVYDASVLVQEILPSPRPAASNLARVSSRRKVPMVSATNP